MACSLLSRYNKELVVIFTFSKSKIIFPYLPGVGRTGTFIALDQLLRVVDDQSRKYVDVFNIVYQLRKERRYLVCSLIYLI